MNFLNFGDVIDVTNPSSSVTIASGSINVIGKLVGVATGDIAPSSNGGLAVRGRFALLKTSGLAIAQGDQVYVNTTTGKVTKTATDIPLGIATDIAQTGDATVNVKLSGNGAEVPGVAADVAGLTDNTGGAVSTTLAALTALSTAGGNTYTDAAVNAKLTIIANSLSSIVSNQTAILTALKGAGLMA